MRNKKLRFGLVGIILALFLFGNFNSVNSMRPVPTLGLKTGDTVTYILDEFTLAIINESVSVASDDDSGLDLLVNIGASYDITVLNDTPVWDGVYHVDYMIPVSMSNGTHSIKTTSPLTPTNFYFSDIDWDYWETTIFADPVSFFDDSELVDFKIINGIDEFRINSTSANNLNATDSVYSHTEFRYNKTDGAINIAKFYTSNYEIFNATDFKITFRRAGYDYNGTSIDTSTSNTASTSTNISPSITESTYSGTTTLSDTVTDTNTMMTTDDSLTTATFTSTTTTRELTSDKQESTLERTNSTSEATESPTATLPVPAFGPLMTFSGIMIALTIIRKKN